MSPHTPFETVQSLAGSARLVLVYRQILGDNLTPISAFCNAGWGPAPAGPQRSRSDETPSLLSAAAASLLMSASLGPDPPMPTAPIMRPPATIGFAAVAGVEVGIGDLGAVTGLDHRQPACPSSAATGSPTGP